MLQKNSKIEVKARNKLLQIQHFSTVWKFRNSIATQFGVKSIAETKYQKLFIFTVLETQDFDL